MLYTIYAHARADQPWPASNFPDAFDHKDTLRVHRCYGTLHLLILRSVHALYTSPYFALITLRGRVVAGLDRAEEIQVGKSASQKRTKTCILVVIWL